MKSCRRLFHGNGCHKMENQTSSSLHQPRIPDPKKLRLIQEITKDTLGLREMATAKEGPELQCCYSLCHTCALHTPPESVECFARVTVGAPILSFPRAANASRVVLVVSWFPGLRVISWNSRAEQICRQLGVPRKRRRFAPRMGELCIALHWSCCYSVSVTFKPHKTMSNDTAICMTAARKQITTTMNGKSFQVVLIAPGKHLTHSPFSSEQFSGMLPNQRHSQFKLHVSRGPQTSQWPLPIQRTRLWSQMA